MQREPEPRQPGSLDFSDLLGTQAPAQTPAQAPGGLDFTDLLAPIEVTPRQPAEATAAPTFPRELPPPLPISQAPREPTQIEPGETIEAGEGPSEFRRFAGTIKTIAQHPLDAIWGALSTPFKQAYAVGTGEWDPNMGMARAERAFLRAEGKLTPQLEAHFQKLEDYEEGRRGLMAFGVSSTVGIGGLVTYPALTGQRPGEAAAFLAAMLPLGVLAHTALRGTPAADVAGAADKVAQLKTVAPLEVNDEPPSSLEAPAYERRGTEIKEEPGGIVFAQTAEQRAQKEALLAAKKLKDYEPTDVARSMWNAAQSLRPYEQLVIPGIDKETLFRGLQSWPEDLDYAVHERPDGKLDVVTYGKESILTDDVAKAQFERSGYFEGQEVYYYGKPYTLVEISRKGESIGTGMEGIPGGTAAGPKDVSVLLRNSVGDEVATLTNRIQRPPYAEMGESTTMLGAEIPPEAAARVMEVVRTQKPLEAHFTDFQKFFDEESLASLTKGKLPDVDDIRGRYPNAWDEAMKYSDPREAMAAFADKMSDLVDSREIDPSLAESIGTRMADYLSKRATNSVSTSFDARVEVYSNWRGIPPAERTGFWRYFANKMGETLRQQGMSPSEYSLFNEKAAQLVKEELTLNELASTNGYQLDVAPTGYFIRDAKTGELLAYGHTPDEVRGFVNGSGAGQGPSLDGGGQSNAVPPGAIGSPAAPPSGPPPLGVNTVDDELHPPYKPSEGWAQRVADGLRLMQPEWLTKREALFTALDNKFGTKLWDRFFRPTQEARARAINAAVPFHDEVVKIWKDYSKFTPDQWEHITNAIEHFSAEELISGRGFARPYTEQEINLANVIGAMKIDMPKVFKYLRALDDSATPEEKAEVDQAFNLDNSHKTAAGIFAFIKSQNINRLSLGMVTRLAHAIMTEEPSRAEYMARAVFKDPATGLARAGFTQEMRDAVDKIEGFTTRIGMAGGIDVKQLINGYIPHYRLSPDAPTMGQAFFFQRGWNATPEAKFLNEMVRTNEIDIYQKHPIAALLRYTNAIFKAREFNPVFKDGMKAAEEEWNKMPPNIKSKAYSIITNYANEISGRPDASNTFTQGVFDKTLEEMHLDVSPNVRGDFVNTIASLIYTSGIGFRPGITLRHVNQFLTLGGSRFGAGILKDAIHWASKGLVEHDLVNQMRNQGMISPLNPSAYLTKDELEASGIGDAINKLESFGQKMATASMTANGLKSVYELTQFGYGMAVRERALSSMARMAAGEIGERELASSIKLDTFQPSIQRAFLTRLRSGDYLDAANLIARQAAKETAFQYGLANHPMGWARNSGRLFGIYGVWPTWMQDYSLSMLSRGTPAARAAWIGGYALMQGVAWLAGRAIGVNPNYLYMGPGFFYDGIGSGAFHALAPGMVETMGGPFMGMLQNAVSAVKEPNPNLREMYKKRLMRNLYGVVIPGRGLYTDIYSAFNDPRVQTPLQVWSRIVGVKPADWNAFR